MAISQAEAHALLERHYDRLFEAVSSGFDGYRRYPDRPIHRRSTRANIVNDRILASIIQEFDEVGGARFVEARRANLRFLEIDGKVLLWFKKTDRLHRPRIFPTRHAERIESGAQLSLFPNQEVLIVGYLLNRDETRVTRVSISKPDGRAKQPSWFIDLERPASTILAVMPQNGGGPNAAPRVRIRMSEPQMTLFR